MSDVLTTKPTSISLVDFCMTPEQTYLVLDALYAFEGMYLPEDVKDAIDYIEGRLMDGEFPLSLEAYEEEIQSPENSAAWKPVDLFFTEELD